MKFDFGLDSDFKFCIWMLKIIKDIYKTMIDFKYMIDQ